MSVPVGLCSEEVLIANRGEIAVRILRACQERGLAHGGGLLRRRPDRAARALRRRGVPHRAAARPRELSQHPGDHRRGAGRPAPTRSIPATASCPRTRHFAQAVLARRPRLGRPAAGRHPGDGRQGGGAPDDDRRRRAGGAGHAMSACSDDEASRVPPSRSATRCWSRPRPGGGGKGMRVVNEPADLPQALAAARREALSAFGDDTVYLEKLITRAPPRRDPDPGRQPRQLRPPGRARVLDPAPAPEADRGSRRRWPSRRSCAPRWARSPCARRRRSATATPGTVEFLLDRSGSFYFLEMNTRLQVEHPVTEMVTGIDIVKEQLAIASGRKLRWDPGRHRLQRPRHRVSHQRRGPVQQLPAAGRAHHQPLRADRAGRAAGERHLRRLGSQPLLRSAAGQADRLGRDARRGDPAHAPRAGGVSHRRHSHDDPVPPAGDGQHRFQGGQFDTQLRRRPGRLSHVGRAQPRSGARWPPSPRPWSSMNAARKPSSWACPATRQRVQVSPWKQTGRTSAMRTR